MNIQSRQAVVRALPFVLMLLAFAVRVYAPDTAWINVDQTYLRGQGIIALDHALQGQFAVLSVFTYSSSSGLLNPGLMVYVWGAIAAIERSQLFATILNLMLDGLAVAMLFSLAKALTNRMIALFAMTLMAVSPWAIGVARGTWQPGQLEFCFVLVAWLLLTGLVRERPRWIIAGFAAAAISMWTYTLAFALVAQAALASLIFLKRSLARPIASGWVICGVSVAVMLVLAGATGQLSTMSSFANWVTSSQAATERQAIVTDPLILALRISTWVDYARTWINPSMPAWRLGETFNQLCALVIAALTGVGLLFAVWSAVKRQSSARIWIALTVWFLLPIVAFTLLKASTGDFLIQQYFLMLTVPAGYLLPAQALHELQNRFNRGYVHWAVRACVYGCVLAAMPFALWSSLSAAESAYAQGYFGELVYMPLKGAEALGELWRRHACDIVHATRFENDVRWVASLWRRSDEIRDEHTSTFTPSSSVWEITPGKVNCMMHEEHHPLPNTVVTPFTFPNGSSAYFYKAQAATQPTRGAELIVNNGWSLVALDTPLQARPGETITVSHVWSIRELPTEPYWNWYFAPNVKLATADGSILSEHWGRSIDGYMWRVGDEIRSTISFQLPSDILAGNYTLLISLFDPNQGKNAVYFLPEKPGEPIVVIQRALRVAASQ